ncbi:diguanylate cyclase [Tolypothrix bouteillei VB521301]|uniref:Diguanylate cyclase n=1 Tax=Tolypothrix bouteillei VB521301 TaxID=1479485 RepID=A0A8S9THB9_9CYAN|nr:diguanylate cyclase [Tolypothrix bouteillei VB521301]
MLQTDHSTEVNQILEAVEQSLLPRRLSSIEKFVLHQSWLGQTYNEMAQSSGYASDYIKEVGSQLWQDISDTVGQRVTKKNLHLVLNQIQTNFIGRQKKEAEPELEIIDKKHESEDVQLLTINKEIPYPNAPLDLTSPFYINRPPVEEIAYQEISQPGCAIGIRAPRKMGKSSLLHRIVSYSKALEYNTVYLDFQEADESIFISLEKFLRWFCANVSRQLNLNPKLDNFWDEDMGSKVSSKLYFEAYILKQVANAVVIVLNEVNRVFEHPTIAKDFLPMLRFWHELAKQEKIWQKCRLVVAHATEICVPLNLNQSPFNVGLTITLPKFTPEQAWDLAQRYGLIWASGEKGKQNLAPLIKMLSGHPYLLNLAFYYLQREEITYEELLQTAATSSGIFSDYLRGNLAILQKAPALVSAFQQVVNSNESVHLDAIAAFKLESMGLIELDGNRAKPSCELYRLYFREQLQHEKIQNVAETEELVTELQKIGYANHLDELTHLPTRHNFNQYMENNWEEWAKEALPISLVLCEVDYFKFFNAAYGYKVGDECLQLIANTISDRLDEYPEYFIARYAGAKFAIIVPLLSTEFALNIATHIRDDVIGLAIKHDRSIFGGFSSRVLTVSLGVASIIPSKENPPEVLVEATESALHQAIRRGRNCVSISATSMVEF